MKQRLRSLPVLGSVTLLLGLATVATSTITLGTIRQFSTPERFSQMLDVNQSRTQVTRLRMLMAKHRPGQPASRNSELLAALNDVSRDARHLAALAFAGAHHSDTAVIAAELADIARPVGAALPTEAKLAQLDALLAPIQASLARLATTSFDQAAAQRHAQQAELTGFYTSCAGFAVAFLLSATGLVLLIRRQQKFAETMALHDQLTGLPNRRLFRERLDELLAAPASRQSGVSVLFLDLDDFKDVNDSLGHVAGDQLLCALTDRLRSVVPNGMLARLGGDEFAVMLPEGGRTAASALAARLRQVLAQPVDLPNGQASSSVSIGAATRRKGSTDSVDLLQQADLAMYEAKAAGRGSFHFFDAALSARLQFRLSIEKDLRTAIEDNQFHLMFQPLIGLHDKRITGFEALLRWQHPVRGLVPPMTFIPIAEQTGLILQIGELVLFQACAEAAKWPGDVRVAVNLSPRQFKTDLVQTVKAALSSTGLPPNRLELEITETVLMQDGDEIEMTLKALRALGVHLALDDFGTGYSSLSYLQRFPFDKIKVDQSFVRSMPQRPESAAIVELITGLAQRLNMTTVAEGIEDAKLLQMVHAAGCTEGQGYYFDRPLPPDITRKRLEAQQAGIPYTATDA